ncbi:transport and golgi organization 1 isoform X2 [Megalopta genalis]|uniref:transport and golgi organization 1 isoform X2 n=1 Tax=Megalopta genalis TaxID=115081 RepID=UPI003FD3BEF7
MMKINRIFDVVFLLLAIILSVIPQCWSTLSDKRLCYDPDCSEPISVARTTIQYLAPDEGFLSFGSNVEVTVYSKEAGSRKDLWGIEHGGKRGYAPKIFLKEYKVHHKNLKHEVPIESTLLSYSKSNKKHQSEKISDKLKPITENVQASSVPTTIDVKSTKELPNNVKSLYEVIDGTTIHVNPTKSSTEQAFATKVLQPAVVPNKEDTVVNVKVDANSEKVTTNIFAKDDKLSQEILNGKEKNDGQNMSQNDNTDVDKTPEKVPDLFQIIGIKLPSMDIGANLINNLFNAADEEEEAAEKIKKVTAIEAEHVKPSKEQVIPSTQDVESSKEQTIPAVQDVKPSKEQSVPEGHGVKIPEERSIPEVHDVKIAEERSVSELQDIKLPKDQSLPKIQDVKAPKEQSVPEVQDVKISKEQAVPEIQNAKALKEQVVPEAQDLKTPKEQVVPETQDVKIPKEQSVPETQDVKISKKQAVPEVQNAKALKEQVIPETQDLKTPKEQVVPEVQDVKIPKEQSVPETQDLKIPKQLVPVVQDAKVAKEETVPELQDVKISKEQAVPEIQNAKALKEQVIPETQDLKTPKEQVVPEVQDVKIPKEQSVPETQDLKIPKQLVPVVQDAKVTKEETVPELQDVKISKEQAVPEIQNVKALKEQIVPEAQDIKTPKEQVVPVVRDAKVTKEETVPELQDVKIPKEQSVQDRQNVKLEEEQSAGKLQDKNMLNTTVGDTTVTISNEIGPTDSVYTISANGSETDTKVALNVTELSNKENIHSMESTQLDTEETKLVENSNIPETRSTILNIKHTVPLPTGMDINSSTELPSSNIDEDGGKQSFNVSFDSISQASPSKYLSENATETIITSGNEENSEEPLENIKAIVEFGNFSYNNEATNATESGDTENLAKIDTNEQVKNLDDSSDSAEFNLHPSGFMYTTKEGSIVSENVASINEFRNRNLLNADTGEHSEIESTKIEQTAEEITSDDDEHQTEDSSEVCTADNVECSIQVESQDSFITDDETSDSMENLIESISLVSNYWMTFVYLIVTATATLIFSLGYYYIENMRRDGQLIAKINKLEKDLLVSTKESSMLKDNLKVTKDKLNCIEDESFGSNEMVLSLKADLEASQIVKAELEDQVSMLEKDLESATEAGLELERMLREVLSSDNEVNPLAQSVEDLQTRLNAQQAANESLTSALNLKTQENESLSTELAFYKKKHEELEVELVRVTESFKSEVDSKNNIHQTLTDKVQELEIQMKDISNEKVALQKELKCKEVETKDLMDVINRLNSNLDLDKLYNVTHIKAEAKALLEERNELKIRLTEVEGAHNLLEEHVKVIKEEVSTLSEQCKTAEKEKKDAETRLEVLSNFFKEKEAQRQKEESIWLQQQGEVVSTVERIQTMQSEIQNYKQQIEMLKREILDQEREYENQISIIEKNAHEQWIKARQVERRLEESKVEAGQLRNRLTLIEKNINDVDPEVKLHRMEANGETATSPPLFIGAESSSSPIMFSGSSNVPPPPPPSYLHSLFPPYLPPPLPNASNVPPYEISQRPPPLGGRLSSPPPMPLHPPNSSRYDNAGSPPPMSPHLLPSFPNLRIPPPSFGNDHFPGPPPPQFVNDHYPGPPPPLGSIMPAPLGTTHSWGEEPLTPLRNSGYHLSQRERVQNHKGRKRFSKVRQFWSTLEGNNCK